MKETSEIGSNISKFYRFDVRMLNVRILNAMILNVKISENIECKNALKLASVKLCQPARNIFSQIKWDSLKFQNYFSNQSSFWIAWAYPLKSGKDSLLESGCILQKRYLTIVSNISNIIWDSKFVHFNQPWYLPIWMIF